MVREQKRLLVVDDDDVIAVGLTDYLVLHGWSADIAHDYDTAKALLQRRSYAVALTDEQFQEEMAKRREHMKSRNAFDIGCPLCWAPPTAQPAATPGGPP